MRRVRVVTEFLPKSGERYFGCIYMDGMVKVRKPFLTGDMIPMRNVKHFFQRVVAYGLGALVMLLAPVGSYAQTTLGTQTLSLTLQAAGDLYNVPTSVALTNTGTTFTAFKGSVTLDYRARTTASTGSGKITVYASTDFSCSGGPCIGTPPTTGDALTFTCTGATLGTNCSGSPAVGVGTAAAQTVVTIPAGACTGAGSPCNNAATNTVSVNFALTDDPKYKTGSYTAILTWTISAA
ncbi:MAG: hypothetical protein ABSA59_14140 [Terriglobia bacterium]|jgi:hypothetical protein